MVPTPHDHSRLRVARGVKLLGHMTHVLLPLISVLFARDADAGRSAPGPNVEHHQHPATAQVRLAELLGSAVEVDVVSVEHASVGFVISTHDGALDVIARTRASNEIVSLRVAPHARPPSDLRSDLDVSWLVPEIADVTAITHLEVVRGRVTLHGYVAAADTTRAYALVARRDDGNTAVASRWNAAWD